MTVITAVVTTIVATTTITTITGPIIHRHRLLHVVIGGDDDHDPPRGVAQRAEAADLEPFAMRLNLIASHQLASTSAFQLLFAESQLRIAECAVGHDLCKSLWESENYWLCSSHAFRIEECGASEQVRREHDRGCDGARGSRT